MARCEERMDNNSATLTLGSGGSITRGYRLFLDAQETNPEVALAAARITGPDPIPDNWDRYSALSPVYATVFALHPFDDDDTGYTVWDIDVTWTSPESQDKENNEGGEIQKAPTQRRTAKNIQYMERSYVVEEARNTVALLKGNGQNGLRAAGTLAPITNAAGVPPDTAITDTERVAVLLFTNNYGTVEDIYNVNKLYKRTTNSDTPGSFAERECKYLITRASGFREENGYGFYTGVTEVAIGDLTDIELDNVGYDYYDGDDLVPIVYEEGADKGQRVSEPRHLNISGGLGTVDDTITYRHLDPVVYQNASGGFIWDTNL